MTKCSYLLFKLNCSCVWLQTVTIQLRLSSCDIHSLSACHVTFTFSSLSFTQLNVVGNHHSTFQEASHRGGYFCCVASLDDTVELLWEQSILPLKRNDWQLSLYMMSADKTHINTFGDEKSGTTPSIWNSK